MFIGPSCLGQINKSIHVGFSASGELDSLPAVSEIMPHKLVCGHLALLLGPDGKSLMVVVMGEQGFCTLFAKPLFCLAN